jgi:hypothetical protein
MAQSNLGLFGYNEVITKSGAYTVVAADSGTIINVTATATITLPATVVGIAPIIRVGAESITVTIAPNASDNIYGGQLTAVDNKALIFTNAPLGSYVQLIADGTVAGGWAIARLDCGGTSSVVTKAP